MNKINILTWNVSWGSMTKNTADITAKYLAGYCRNISDNKTSKCLENVSQFIDDSGKRNKYDFIALQEATNWELIKKNSKVLSKMGYIHHKNTNEDLITFYDETKYKLIDFSKKMVGKNYQILFFYGLLDSNYYIFINLHIGHRVPVEDVEKTISKNIDVNFKKINKDIKFNVIVTGDFNDHGHSDYWKGLKPFKYTKFTNLKNIIVSCPEPPLTCCVGRTSIRKGNNEDTMYGDYTLVNEELKFVKPNYIPRNFIKNARIFPSSDHLPVSASLTMSRMPRLLREPRLIQHS